MTKFTEPANILSIIERYVVLKDTVIYAYNTVDGSKHRQTLANDMIFDKSSVLGSDENDVYRITLNKDVWLWFEIDSADLHIVTIKKKQPTTIIDKLSVDFLKALE